MDAGELFYKEIRDQIKHEDNLCNNRMTWLITLQSFLLGAYAFSSTSFNPTACSSSLEFLRAGQTGIMFIGVISALFICISLYSAKSSTDALVKQWRDSSHYQLDRGRFPQIIGNQSDENAFGERLARLPLFTIPLFFFLTWSYIAINIKDPKIIPLFVISILIIFIIYTYQTSLKG